MFAIKCDYMVGSGLKWNQSLLLVKYGSVQKRASPKDEEMPDWSGFKVKFGLDFDNIKRQCLY